MLCKRKARLIDRTLACRCRKCLSQTRLNVVSWRTRPRFLTRLMVILKNIVRHTLFKKVFIFPKEMRILETAPESKSTR
jgi:transposase